jgi:GMP reductase
MDQWDVPFICVDVANGYQTNFIDFVKRVRTDFPDKIIIVGNVITPEIVEELLISGADIIKCGIGPGSVCTTRIVAGVGYPQLSGIIECADAAHGVGGSIISDGGCVYPGDVAKAFCAGADFVMLGGMLAGCDEGEYDEIKNDKVIFYGMSSKEAVRKHGARKDGYKTCEGRVISLPYKEAVEPIVEEILGGIISSCAYIGARRLKDMSKCATFVKVNQTHNRYFEKYDVEK